MTVASELPPVTAAGAGAATAPAAGQENLSPSEAVCLWATCCCPADAASGISAAARSGREHALQHPLSSDGFIESGRRPRPG